MLEEKNQATKEPLVGHKPGQIDEAPSSENYAKGKPGRGGASQAEEKVRPFETSQTSHTVPSPLEPVSLRTEKAPQAEKVEPKISRSGWASRYAGTTSNDKSQEKLQRSEKSLKSGKQAVSTDAPRDLLSDQDGQAFKSEPRSAAENGGSTFKQRMQEGLGITKENHLLKPLKSKFSGANKQETSRPIAGEPQVPQTGGSRPYQQPDPSTTLDKPVKDFKPYTVSKPSVASGFKTEVSKNNMPFVEQWLSSNNSETPSRPERSQDELFMGVSGSNPRPSPSLGNTSALGISQPSPSSDSKARQKSPRDFIVPVSEVKTDRPDRAMTREPTEGPQSSKPEQDSREYTLVTARSPVNLSSDSSKRGKTETPAVRIVSGIIERPREIEIQKPSETDKATRPSKREHQSHRSAAEKFDAVTSCQRKSNETKEIDSLPGDAAQTLKVADHSSKQEDEFGNRSRDQGRQVDTSETRKLAPVDDQWPRPQFAGSVSVGSDATNSPRRINGKETFTSEGTKLSAPGDPDSVDADASNKPGGLGRWTGRGKKDKATERTKQPPTNQPSLVTTAIHVGSSFASASSAQRPAPQEGPEVGVPAVRPDDLTREITGTSTRPVMETPSNDLLASGATQKAASDSVASGNVKEKDSSPSLSKSPISALQHDAPAPLFMGGHKPFLKEAATKSREGFVPYSPSEAEKQMSAKDRPADRNIADRDMLYTRAEKSNLTSPEMPSQEDFFKQMRQSVMFQNADSIKMDLPESTDATSKRKSRRNRNFSISGLQPARETAVPDLPTLSNPEQRSAVGGGNSIVYSDVPQAASASWFEPTSFEKPERREIFGSDLASDSHVQSSKAKPRQEEWSNMQPSASALGEQLGAESRTSPQMQLGSSERAPTAELSPPSMPTRVEEFASPQPSSSSLPTGERVGRTTATEMAQADVPSISTKKREFPDVFFKPATVIEHDHVHGTEQADLHRFDLKDKSWNPPEPTFSKRRPERGLDFDRSIPAASRDTEYDETNEQIQEPRTTEAERMPPHPAPSSAGIFRRSSFGDEEGLQQPMTTHNLPPAEDHNDPKIQSFFDGLFKSKRSEDLALGLDSTPSIKRELTDDGQARNFASDNSKGLSRLLQTHDFGADKEIGALEGTSSSPSLVAGDREAVRINSLPSEADPRSSPSINTGAGAQEPKEVLSVSSAPMTPYEPVTRDVEHFETPRELSTSRSLETSDPPIKGKATDMSSPYSADVPMLIVEDVSAYPLSRDESTATYSKSPKTSGELEPQREKPKLNDAAIPPRMDHDTPGLFATKYREEEEQMPQAASTSIQDKYADQAVATPCTASETNFQDFVKEKAASPEQPDFIVGNSHVNNEYTNSDKNMDLHGGIGKTNVLPQRSPIFAMHDDRQKGSDSPSESGGYLEQAIAPTSLDSSFVSQQESRGIDNYGSSWTQSPEGKKDLARPSKFHDEPEDLESNDYRDHINPNQFPRPGVGLISSPQESDPDLSDHILSLYDGSDFIAPEHQVNHGFPQNAPSSSERQDAWPVMESAHTKSLSDLHSSVTDHRDSMSSIGPVITENPNMSAHPSDAKDSWAPGRSASRLSTSEPIAGFPTPAMTPTHDPSNPVNFQTENMVRESPKATGLKERLRMFFSKSETSEPGYESHAQPVADSSVHEPSQSPEPLDQMTLPHGDNDISTHNASPTVESRTEETVHGRDRVPFGDANAISPRAEDEMERGFLSPQMLEAGHPLQQAKSPEPQGIHMAQLNEAEKGVSPLRSVYSPEPLPAITAPEQWDSPLLVNHDQEERKSPYDNQSSLSASPFVTGDDEGRFSHQDGHQMQDMDEFDTQGIPTPRDETSMPVTSLLDSQLPEVINASTSLRGTPDLNDTRQHWSPRPEEEHDMFNSAVEKMDVFDPTSPQMESMSKAHVANEHLPMSPESTAHYARKDDSRDVPMFEEENFRISSPHLLEHETSRPDLGIHGFHSGESPVPEETTHWGNNDFDQICDSNKGSPRSDHMDVGPANVMDMDKSPDLRSPEGEPWNDTPLQTGSFSPAAKDEYHSGDGVMMGSAEPDFDTAAAYSDHHEVPDDHCTAEHGEARDDFDNTPNDEFRVQEYEDMNQVFGHPGASGSSFGNDEIHDEVDDFGGTQSHAQDFPGHHEEFNGIESESYPADHQLENHDGDFDDFEKDRLPTDAFNDRPETLDSPRMDNYPADHQSHPGGFDDFQGDRIPADDFNDHPETFDEPEMESYPADHQSHESGFSDFEDNGLPTDDFNDHPETFDSPRMDNHPAEDLPLNVGGLPDYHGPMSDVYQEDMGPMDEVPMDHYPADEPPSPGGGFEESGVDNYPVDDFQRQSGTFGGAEMGPQDDFPYDTAEPNDSAFDSYDAESIGEEMPSYEQDHEAGYPSGGVDDFNPGHDDVPYNEAPLSDYGGDQGPGFDQESEPFADDNLQGDYPQDGPLDDGHYGSDGFAGGEPEFGDHGDGMDFNDNGEGDVDETRGDEFDNQDYGADADHDLGGDVGHFDGEPSWEGDVEPANFDEGGFGGEGEPVAEDWGGDQMDEGRGLDGGEEYPMDGGEELPMDGGVEDYPLEGDESRFPDAMEDGDMPMGGEAEEYYMGGEGVQSPGSLDEGEFPVGGEADDFMMGGDEEAEYPMETMDGGDEFRMDGDEELPIGEMYGEGDRSMEPMEGEEFPMGDGEASPLVDREEYPMDQEDGFTMEGEDVEGSDREIEDFDGDGQFEDDMSEHGSMPDEEIGSQFDDGSVDARSLVDDEAGSQVADEDGGSEVSDPFDEEPAGDLDAEDEDFAPSEVEDRKIEGEEAEMNPTSLADEEDVDGEEEQDMDDLYEADVPSIPASPTSTDHDRELDDLDDDGQDEDNDIFGEPAPQEDPADLENADPVRLSCLYMQDVGLISSLSSPTVPEASDTAEQNEAEEEEEQPREPVRFSALYRQSLDWSQALDSSMWENEDESLPEQDEEQEVTAPIVEGVPDSAKRQSQEELRMLEVDQEPLTPVAASPLSPRPLETPPPDYDHSNAIEAHQVVEEPEELYKGADDNGHQQFSVSPRLQPTPPPDQDQSSVNNDGQDDRRDSRGPQTFDEMNLPRRVISPQNAGENHDDPGGPSQASSSTNMAMHTRGRSISQRFSGWWSGGGSSPQVPARPPPLPAPYDSRYGEPSSPA